ncbi:Hypothetical protein GSB_150665 [Giardia duodenalis]|uniref:RING-type domain-containing protein n=1 Tax=Giardia intestinalis TaxID=5741 RepID=V6U7C7_GIAIN|nr:Hypothetical protein GSB_150665 [Giardia intestinalis]
MAFIFGEEAFYARASYEPSGSTDSVDPNGEEWDMWETLKALRVQTKRRGLRAHKYRLAALRFKRSSIKAHQKADELQSRYLNALERTEAVTRSFVTLMDELDEAKAKLAAREKEASTCVICLYNARGVAFVPCGHIACCQQCADQIERHARGRDFPRCPICREHCDWAQRLFYA